MQMCACAHGFVWIPTDLSMHIYISYATKLNKVLNPLVNFKLEIKHQKEAKLVLDVNSLQI